MLFQLLSFSFAFFGSGLIKNVDASCYYPDGSFPSDYAYVPCSGDEFTSCCIMSEGDQCLSNGLCYYPGGYMFRGACSDKNWNSPNCFQHCKNSTNSYSNSYDRIVPCGGDRYCCYSDASTCCNDDSKVFSIGSPTVIKDFASTKSSGFPIATPTESTRTGTSPASLSRATNTETRAEASGARPTNTAASTTPASTSSSSGSASEANPNAHTFSKTTVIAASAAGLLAFIIIVALFWFFIRRHYRNKLATGAQDQSFPMSSDGFHKLPDKSPRPVEVPAPLHSPAPPYQPPAYQHSPYATNGAVEIDNSYLPPQRNPWGQPVFEAPAQPYRHV